MKFKTKSTTRVFLFDNGMEEIAIFPYSNSAMGCLQISSHHGYRHYASPSGKLLLSVDLQECAVNYCDPSIQIEHKFEDLMQRFQGNFISLRPLGTFQKVEE